MFDHPMSRVAYENVAVVNLNPILDHWVGRLALEVGQILRWLMQGYQPH